ncbi:MAG: diphthamide synthesis protein, partial [Thermoplasmata archaeon]|nr:diphthamide synthesis protein [Thermoplasmata archaeon]
MLMFQGFEFNAKALMAEIKSRGWIRIAIQAPAGLLRDAAQLSLYLRERGYEPAVLVDPCFGACDLAETPESYDGVVHLGHAPFPNQEEAMFLELPSKAENLEILEKSDALPSRLGLVATVQHLSLIPIAKSMLEDCGHEVHVGDAGGRIAHPGQVLGCNTKAARAVADKVDA